VSAPTKSRRETELTFLRLIPGTSFVHRLWAGTKLVTAAVLAIMLTIAPTWPMVGVVTGVVLIGLLAGHIPLGAFPRLPRWFYATMGVAALLSMWSRVEPTVDVGGIELSMGGLEQWARFTAIAVALIVSGAIVGWTTQLADVAPALRRLFAPLRLVRAPVDEWVAGIALAIRCLPLLIDEIRVLMAARRLRVHDANGERDGKQLTIKQGMIEVHDMLSTAIVASLRRARDLADAMEARGGFGGGVSSGRNGPAFVDWVVLIGLTALAVVTLGVLHL
jgi:energy-coupling factor transporter transmembrane protein EcfT